MDDLGQLTVHFHYDEIGAKAFWTELEASEHIN